MQEQATRGETMNSKTKKDLVIIAHLRQNAREQLTNISKRTRIPVSTLHDRLRQTQANVITRHTTLLDFSKIGFNTKAGILLRSEKEERKKLREYLIKHPSINTLQKISGGYDFLAEVVFRNIFELEEFVESLDAFKVVDKKVFYVLEDLKKEAFLSEPEMVHAVVNSEQRV